MSPEEAPPTSPGVVAIRLPLPPGAPETPVRNLHAASDMPAGQILPYEQSVSRWRRTELEEAAASSRVTESALCCLREAAEAHRTVRLWAREWIRPGMRLLDIADGVEEALRRTVGARGGLERGIAFPTGLSRNHCAAHWTPGARDTEAVLCADDVLKVDMGVHVGGHIIDSAFTLTWNPAYEPLLETVRAATDAAVAAAGVDVRLADIGDVVEEVMSAGEVTVCGCTRRVRPVRNVSGHSLGLYRIHAGKCVPIHAHSGERGVMEEGDVLAIETFGSTGRGYARDHGTGLPTSHFMLRPRAASTRSAARSATALKMRGAGPQEHRLLEHLRCNYGTLAFASRWLGQGGMRGYGRALKNLVARGVVDDCPPLCDVEGSLVAQFEHTIVLGSTAKEVLSRGPDY